MLLLHVYMSLFPYKNCVALYIIVSVVKNALKLFMMDTVHVYRSL